MKANTTIDAMAAVAKSGSSTTMRCGRTNRQNASVGKTRDPITAIGTRMVSSRLYFVWTAASVSVDIRPSLPS